METITLQVDPAIAKAYREAEPEKQKNALIVCNLILKEFLKIQVLKKLFNRFAKKQNKTA